MYCIVRVSPLATGTSHSFTVLVLALLQLLPIEVTSFLRPKGPKRAVPRKPPSFFRCCRHLVSAAAYVLYCLVPRFAPHWGGETPGPRRLPFALCPEVGGPCVTTYKISPLYDIRVLVSAARLQSISTASTSGWSKRYRRRDLVPQPTTFSCLRRRPPFLLLRLPLMACVLIYLSCFDSVP